MFLDNLTNKNLGLLNLQSSDDTTGNSSTSVASLLGIRVFRPTEVISFLMEYDTPAQDAVRTAQRDESVIHVDLAGVVLVEDYIAKVAYVTVLVSWVTMVFLWMQKRKKVCQTVVPLKY